MTPINTDELEQLRDHIIERPAGDIDHQAVDRQLGLRRMSEHAIEACAALCGLLGAFLLAAKCEHAAWGWVAFLASNVGWLAFGWIRRHWFLLAQQIGFTATSLLGIWRWLL